MQMDQSTQGFSSGLTIIAACSCWMNRDHIVVQLSLLYTVVGLMLARMLFLRVLF